MDDRNNQTANSKKNTAPAHENGRRAETQCPWCSFREAIIQSGIFRCPRCSYETDVSEPPQIRVIGWTTADDRDYLEFECRTAAIYNAIVKEIREKGYRISWYAHQSELQPCTPVINNGYKIYCGPRTWGSIMAEALGASDSDPSAYAEYAFCTEDDPIYPQRSVDRQQIIPFEIPKDQ